jgi:hypothetical protein
VTRKLPQGASSILSWNNPFWSNCQMIPADWKTLLEASNPFWSIPCWVLMLAFNVGISAARKQKTTGTQDSA